MKEVLVLNRNYYAMHIADWKKVMALLFKGHAVALDEDLNRYGFNEWKELSQHMEDNPAGFVNAVNFRIAIPEVICLTFYDELPRTDVRFTRKNIYKHYGYKCCYCGNRFKSENLNMDHILPKSRGGKTEWSNIVLACIPCNSDKDNRTPREAKMKMHYRASKPKWRPAYAVKIDTGISVKQSWRKFVDDVYWNTELESDN